MCEAGACPTYLRHTPQLSSNAICRVASATSSFEALKAVEHVTYTGCQSPYRFFFFIFPPSLFIERAERGRRARVKPVSLECDTSHQRGSGITSNSCRWYWLLIKGEMAVVSNHTFTAPASLMNNGAKITARLKFSFLVCRC